MYVTAGLVNATALTSFGVAGVAGGFLLAGTAALVVSVSAATYLAVMLRRQRTIANELERDLKGLRAQNVAHHHAQKMEAVGRLAAGIAHEINTPVQFIGNNLEFLQRSFANFDGEVTNENVVRIGDAIDDSMDGIRHIGSIVGAMKAFGHPGGETFNRADVNVLIENTRIVAQCAVKDVAEVTLELGDLPQVLCSATDLYQVFLNLMVNAGDAIASTGGRGTIMVRTYAANDDVVIEISDTGSGMAPEVRKRIFEPMFTTKEVGAGSGLGLAFAWTTVVDQHGGSIACETTLGMGTKFIVRIPVKTAASPRLDSVMSRAVVGSGK